MRKTHVFFLVVSLGLFSGAGWFAFERSKEPAFVELPVEQPYEAASTTLPANEPALQEPVSPPSPAVLPLVPPPTPGGALAGEVNLAIPFTSQAPHANWDEFHQEFCEEASLLMAASYIRGEAIVGPEDADQKMFAIKAFEEVRFGYWKDTTAEETAVILREHYGIAQVSVVYDPTIAQIRETVAQGKAVVLPAAGRQLGNPYFTQPGPLYHMLVVKGYTKDGRFITNDPGTRRGADYLYDANILWNAIHDWNGGDVTNGKKVMIVVG